MRARDRVATFVAASVLAVIGVLAPSSAEIRPRAAPALLPPPPTVFGVPPSCAVVADVVPSATTVRVGDVVTFTASLRAHCPQLLSSRAVLFVVGGLPEPIVGPVRNSLGWFVDTVARAGGSMAQLILVDRNVQPAGWSVEEWQFAALAGDVRSLAASPARSAEDWTATMAIAEGIVRAVPPSKGPMLIVLDGFRVADGNADAEAAAAAAVAGAVRTTRDGAGRTVIFAVDGAEWLRRVIEAIGPDFVDHMLLVHTTMAGVDAAIWRTLATFHAPLTVWYGSMSELGLGSLQPIAADPAPIVMEAHGIMWQAPLTGHTIDLTTTGVFRILEGVGATRLLFHPQFVRQGVALEQGPLAVALMCVRPAASEPSEPCPEPVDPPSSVPPTPGAAATPAPTRPPDSGMRWRIWLPHADRQPPVASDR